jgi:hypothetical protein
MSGNQSRKKRTIEDYGWFKKDGHKVNSIVNSGLKTELQHILSIESNPHFIFTDNENFSQRLPDVMLDDKVLGDKSTERAAIVETSNVDNKYFQLFYRIRNGLAHGNFALSLDPNGERMVVIQDNDRYSVTARIIIRMKTILKFIDIIDRNNLLGGQVTKS